MWITLKLCALLLLMSSDITLARTRVNWTSPRCQKKYYKESRKPDFSGVGKRVSEIKCVEYTWQVKDNIDRENYYKSCTRKYSIAGGQKTMITRFPHMAAIGWERKDNSWIFLCGGSLISPDFILTAAHCTKAKPNENNLKYRKPQIVRMGTTNIYKKDSLLEEPINRKIRKIIVYPKYSPPKMYYDIALIKIDEVIFTKYVHPACLYNSMDEIKHPLNATGWGLTSTKKSSPVLQSAVLDIIHWNECSNVVHNRNWKRVEVHQTCAGKIDGSAGTCNGDSGAPLQYRKPDQYEDTNMNVIVGITSFGRKCNPHLQPLGVYVNINHFIDWIESNVWQKEEKYLGIS